MQSYISETKTTPVVMECDVLVAGGGTAGTIAAIAAARNGARTVLIERHGHLGGSMVNGAGPSTVSSTCTRHFQKRAKYR